VLPSAPMAAPSKPVPFVHNSSVRPGIVGLVAQGIREAISRRQLIRYLVQADLKKKGSDTLLGNVWWVLDPLLQMAVYVVLVSIIFDRPQPDFPLFVFAAILPWKWFTSSINDSINSIVQQGPLIRQLQFPKIVLPFAATFAGVVNFSFGMIPLAALLLLLYHDRIGPYLLFIPVIALVQLTFTLAFSLVLSALNVFLRDIGNIARHALRLWFYLSPGLYAIETLQNSTGLKLHPRVLDILKANPFATLFTAYRNVIYGTPTGGPLAPDWGALGALMLVSCGLILGAMAVFKRLEPSFAKVL
jgi:ABC-type polysaccharide/polyol phosphate export permease